MKCRLLNLSNDTIIKGAELVGGQFAMLKEVWNHFMAGQGMEDFKDELFPKTEGELAWVIGREFHGNTTDPMIGAISVDSKKYPSLRGKTDNQA